MIVLTLKVIVLTRRNEPGPDSLGLSGLTTSLHADAFSSRPLVHHRSHREIRRQRPRARGGPISHLQIVKPQSRASSKQTP
jgi:hypothetical protein